MASEAIQVAWGCQPAAIAAPRARARRAFYGFARRSVRSLAGRPRLQAAFLGWLPSPQDQGERKTRTVLSPQEGPSQVAVGKTLSEPRRYLLVGLGWGLARENGSWTKYGRRQSEGRRRLHSGPPPSPRKCLSESPTSEASAQLATLTRAGQRECTPAHTMSPRRATREVIKRGVFPSHTHRPTFNLGMGRIFHVHCSTRRHISRWNGFASQRGRSWRCRGERREGPSPYSR